MRSRSRSPTLCLELSRRTGLADLDMWSRPDAVVRLISGNRDDVPVELIWWSRAYTEERVRAILAAEILDGRLKAAEALAHGVALRTAGLLAGWHERLREYPDAVASAVIEDAAELWGGYRPAALLTVARPGERLALVERLVDDAHRVVRIVFALNREWEPSSKRLAARLEPLPIKPERLAARIEAALAEPEPRRALLGMAELAAEALVPAPAGPYADRARVWLAELAELLR